MSVEPCRCFAHRWSAVSGRCRDLCRPQRLRAGSHEHFLSGPPLRRSSARQGSRPLFTSRSVWPIVICCGSLPSPSVRAVPPNSSTSTFERRPPIERAGRLGTIPERDRDVAQRRSWRRPARTAAGFVNTFDAQCRRFGLDAEVLVVEWNPPGDRPRLHQLVTPPRGCAFTLRFIEVRRRCTTGCRTRTCCRCSK